MGAGGGDPTVSSPRKACSGKASRGGWGVCRGRAGVRGGAPLCSSVHVCLCVRVRAWQTHKGGRMLSFQKRCGDISEDVLSSRSGGSQRTRAPCPRRSLDPHAGPFGSDRGHLPRFPGRGLCPERRRLTSEAGVGPAGRPRVTARARGDPAGSGAAGSARPSPPQGSDPARRCPPRPRAPPPSRPPQPCPAAAAAE